MSVRLLPASRVAPPNLEQMLLELGDGENGFMGTTFGRGQVSLQEFLELCLSELDKSHLKPGRVVQSIFWLIVSGGNAIGMIRVRHYLNDALRKNGGHIGYWISPSEREKGYGKRALALALQELQRLGEQRALLTINPANRASVAVVLANGGEEDGTELDLHTGETIQRFWINLSPHRMHTDKQSLPTID